MVGELIRVWCGGLWNSTQDNQTNTKADNQSTAAMTVVVVVFFLSLGPEDKQTSKSLCKKGGVRAHPPPSPLRSLKGPGAEREGPRVERQAN